MPGEHPAFFVPVTAAWGLRSDLERELGKEVADRILFDFGRACGEGLIRGGTGEKPGLYTVEKECIRLNFERPVVVQFETAASDGITLTVKDSIGLPEEYLCGYVTGIFSAFFEEPYVLDRKVKTKGEVLGLLLKPATGGPPGVVVLEPAEQKDRLRKGIMYILPGESQEDHAFKVFKEHIDLGIPGLCISRMRPDEIRDKYGFGQVTMYWLSEGSDSADYIIRPSKLEFELTRIMKEFYMDNEGGIAVLQGLEYLYTRAKYAHITNFIQSVADHVATTGGYLLCPVNPEVFKERSEYEALKTEFEVLTKRDPGMDLVAKYVRDLVKRD